MKRSGAIISRKKTSVPSTKKYLRTPEANGPRPSGQDVAPLSIVKEEGSFKIEEVLLTAGLVLECLSQSISNEAPYRSFNEAKIKLEQSNLIDTDRGLKIFEKLISTDSNTP